MSLVLALAGGNNMMESLVCVGNMVQSNDGQNCSY